MSGSAVLEKAKANTETESAKQSAPEKSSMFSSLTDRKTESENS